MKPVPKAPSDLDYQAKKKWDELIGIVDVDADFETLSNFCRQHSSLLAIRRELQKQRKRGGFKTLTKGRDGSQVLNPLLVAETRQIASLARMLKTLGLTRPSGAGANRTLPSTPRPLGLRGEEPPHGWALEEKLCGKPSRLM
jgi:phage terminase small subunit